MHIVGVLTIWYVSIAFLLLAVVLVLPAISWSPYAGRCVTTWVCWGVSPTEALVLGYFVVVFSVLLYSALNWANKHVPPSTVFIYTVVQPVSAAVISAAIVGCGCVVHLALMFESFFFVLAKA